MTQWLDLSSNSSFLLCVVIKRKKTQTAHSHNINNPDSPWSSQEVRRLLHHLLRSPNSWQPLCGSRLPGQWYQLCSTAEHRVTGTLWRCWVARRVTLGRRPSYPAVSSRRLCLGQLATRRGDPAARWPLHPVHSRATKLLHGWVGQ